MRQTLLTAMTLTLCWAVAAEAQDACAGDCSGGEVVTVDELLLASTIALGEAPLTRCPAADASGDGRVTVNEILEAIDNALIGCPRVPGFPTVVNRNSGKCLEVAAASTLVGANVQQGTCTGAPHQRWSFVADGDDHVIVNSHSGLCLEVAGASKLDKANIRQGTCTAGAGQRWQIVRHDGDFLISSIHSARCLDVEASSFADGGNILQFECRATNNQLWSLPDDALQPGS